MRKSVFIFLIIIIMLFCCGYASCVPKREQVYGVGDIWSNDSVNIQLNSSEYSVNRLESTVNLQLTFTINTTSEYLINAEDLYVYISVDKKIYTSTDQNEISNGFDILNKAITEETQYAFFFNLPLDSFTDENGRIILGSWEVRCFINPACFNITVEI